MDTANGNTGDHKRAHTDGPLNGTDRKRAWRAKQRAARDALRAALPPRPRGRRSDVTDEQLWPDAERPVSLESERTRQRQERARAAAKQARPSRRRASRHSPHPGVCLLPPTGRHDWRAKYVDPVSGRARKVTLPRYRNATAEARAEWAIELSESIQRTLDERMLGKVSTNVMSVGAAVDEWLASENTWATGTQRSYDLATRALRDYLGETRKTDAIDKALLIRYRTFLQTAPRLIKRNGNTGPLAPKTLNMYLTIAKTFLRWAHDAAGLRVSLDDIALSLKAVRAPHERLSFLSRDEIVATLIAAKRLEPAAYETIRFLLLTGLRVHEAFALTWADVDEGDRLRIMARVTKTRVARDVDLTVAPTALPTRADVADNAPVVRISRLQLRRAFERLRGCKGVPDTLSAQMLRRTCSTYFTNAFNPWRSAKSLGHSVQIAEKHYAGLVRMPTDSEGREIAVATLEQAMGVEGLASVAVLKAPRKLRKDAGVPQRPRGQLRYRDSDDPRHKGTVARHR